MASICLDEQIKKPEFATQARKYLDGYYFRRVTDPGFFSFVVNMTVLERKILCCVLPRRTDCLHENIECKDIPLFRNYTDLLLDILGEPWSKEHLCKKTKSEDQSKIDCSDILIDEGCFMDIGNGFLLILVIHVIMCMLSVI